MTLTRNFPGRKHQRRLEALARLLVRWDGVPVEKMPTQVYSEIKTLRERVQSPDLSHTKKRRLGKRNQDQ